MLGQWPRSYRPDQTERIAELASAYGDDVKVAADQIVQEVRDGRIKDLLSDEEAVELALRRTKNMQ